MPETFGVATWPGVPAFDSCTYTCSHGTQPGVATLVVPEAFAAQAAGQGTLTIQDGVNKPLALKNCVVVGVTSTATSEGGRGVALQIADRRYWWKYQGVIAGWYNQPDPEPSLGVLLEQVAGPNAHFYTTKGPFVPGTEREPVDLIRLALGAMGETGYATVEVPTGPRPVCDWQGDQAVSVLDRVADEVGCLVVYQPFKNRVLVTRPADAAVQAGTVPTHDERAEVTPRVTPPKFGVVGNPVLVADYLPLEPVGLDGDGQIKPIDQLSYKPAAGWGKYHPGNHWQDVIKGKCPDVYVARALAKEWVWRAYRVTLTQQLGNPAPDVIKKDLEAIFGPIKSVRQIHLESQVFTAEKDALGRPITRDAVCAGVVFIATGWDVLNSDLGDGALPFGFTVDPLRQVVMFDRRVYKGTDTGSGITHYLKADAPTHLYLYTSFSVRSARTGQFLLGQWGDCGLGSEVTRRQDLVPVRVRSRLVSGGMASLGEVTNLDELKKAADYYMAVAKYRHQPRAAQTKTLDGVREVDPDGAVRQVTWRVGGGAPATTTVSLHAEHTPWLPDYPQRRQAQLVGDLVRRADVVADLMKKKDWDWWRRFNLRKGRS